MLISKGTADNLITALADELGCPEGDITLPRNAGATSSELQLGFRLRAQAAAFVHEYQGGKLARAPGAPESVFDIKTHTNATPAQPEVCRALCRRHPSDEEVRFPSASRAANHDRGANNGPSFNRPDVDGGADSKLRHPPLTPRPQTESDGGDSPARRLRKESGPLFTPQRGMAPPLTSRSSEPSPSALQDVHERAPPCPDVRRSENRPMEFDYSSDEEFLRGKYGAGLLADAADDLLADEVDGIYFEDHEVGALDAVEEPQRKKKKISLGFDFDDDFLLQEVSVDEMSVDQVSLADLIREDDLGDLHEEEAREPKKERAKKTAVRILTVKGASDYQCLLKLMKTVKTSTTTEEVLLDGFVVDVCVFCWQVGGSAAKKKPKSDMVGDLMTACQEASSAKKGLIRAARDLKLLRHCARAAGGANSGFKNVSKKWKKATVHDDNDAKTESSEQEAWAITLWGAASKKIAENEVDCRRASNYFRRIRVASLTTHSAKELTTILSGVRDAFAKKKNVRRVVINRRAFTPEWFKPETAKWQADPDSIPKPIAAYFQWRRTHNSSKSQHPTKAQAPEIWIEATDPQAIREVADAAAAACGWSVWTHKDEGSVLPLLYATQRTDHPIFLAPAEEIQLLNGTREILQERGRALSSRLGDAARARAGTKRAATEKPSPDGQKTANPNELPLLRFARKSNTITADDGAGPAVWKMVRTIQRNLTISASDDQWIRGRLRIDDVEHRRYEALPTKTVHALRFEYKGARNIAPWEKQQIDAINQELRPDGRCLSPKTAFYPDTLFLVNVGTADKWAEEFEAQNKKNENWQKNMKEAYYQKYPKGSAAEKALSEKSAARRVISAARRKNLDPQPALPGAAVESELLRGKKGVSSPTNQDQKSGVAKTLEGAPARSETRLKKCNASAAVPTQQPDAAVTVTGNVKAAGRRAAAKNSAAAAPALSQTGKSTANVVADKNSGRKLMEKGASPPRKKIRLAVTSLPVPGDSADGNQGEVHAASSSAGSSSRIAPVSTGKTADQIAADVAASSSDPLPAAVAVSVGKFKHSPQIASALIGSKSAALLRTASGTEVIYSSAKNRTNLAKVLHLEVSQKRPFYASVKYNRGDLAEVVAGKDGFLEVRMIAGFFIKNPAPASWQVVILTGCRSAWVAIGENLPASEWKDDWMAAALAHTAVDREERDKSGTQSGGQLSWSVTKAGNIVWGDTSSRRTGARIAAAAGIRETMPGADGEVVGDDIAEGGNLQAVASFNSNGSQTNMNKIEDIACETARIAAEKDCGAWRLTVLEQETHVIKMAPDDFGAKSTPREQFQIRTLAATDDGDVGGLATGGAAVRDLREASTERPCPPPRASFAKTILVKDADPDSATEVIMPQRNKKDFFAWIAAAIGAEDNALRVSVYAPPFSWSPVEMDTQAVRRQIKEAGGWIAAARRRADGIIVGGDLNSEYSDVSRTFTESSVSLSFGYWQADSSEPCGTVADAESSSSFSDHAAILVTGSAITPDDSSSADNCGVADADWTRKFWRKEAREEEINSHIRAAILPVEPPAMIFGRFDECRIVPKNYLPTDGIRAASELERCGDIGSGCKTGRSEKMDPDDEKKFVLATEEKLPSTASVQEFEEGVAGCLVSLGLAAERSFSGAIPRQERAAADEPKPGAGREGAAAPFFGLKRGQPVEVPCGLLIDGYPAMSSLMATAGVLRHFLWKPAILKQAAGASLDLRACFDAIPERAVVVILLNLGVHPVLILRELLRIGGRKVFMTSGRWTVLAEKSHHCLQGTAVAMEVGAVLLVPLLRTIRKFLRSCYTADGSLSAKTITAAAEKLELDMDQLQKLWEAPVHEVNVDDLDVKHGGNPNRKRSTIFDIGSGDHEKPSDTDTGEILSTIEASSVVDDTEISFPFQPNDVPAGRVERVWEGIARALHRFADVVRVFFAIKKCEAMIIGGDEDTSKQQVEEAARQVAKFLCIFGRKIQMKQTLILFGFRLYRFHAGLNHDALFLSDVRSRIYLAEAVLKQLFQGRDKLSADLVFQEYMYATMSKIRHILAAKLCHDGPEGGSCIKKVEEQVLRKALMYAGMPADAATVVATKMQLALRRSILKQIRSAALKAAAATAPKLLPHLAAFVSFGLEEDDAFERHELLACGHDAALSSKESWNIEGTQFRWMEQVNGSLLEYDTIIRRSEGSAATVVRGAAAVKKNPVIRKAAKNLGIVVLTESREVAAGILHEDEVPRGAELMLSHQVTQPAAWRTEVDDEEDEEAEDGVSVEADNSMDDLMSKWEAVASSAETGSLKKIRSNTRSAFAKT
eukprot:g19423.t1